MTYLTDKEFSQIFSKVPRICVDIVIRNEKGVLLSLRAHDPYKGMWHIPGGTLYKDETFAIAAVRIAKRELGVAVIPKRCLGVMEFFQENRFNTSIHSISIGFEVDLADDNFVLDGDTAEVKFFKQSPLNFVQGQKDFLEKNGMIHN